MTEVWKQSSECEYIEVSNLGGVRSVSRTHLVNNRHGGQSYRTDKSKQLSVTDNGNGYKIVSTTDNGKRKNFYVHRLVAKEFVDGYAEGLVVDHINHNRGDNRAENLAWVSQKENVARSVEMMKKPRKCVKTNTGEKYISLHMHGKHKGLYRVHSGRFFESLEEAVAYRNEVMTNVG